jgi:hypothetical protein
VGQRVGANGDLPRLLSPACYANNRLTAVLPVCEIVSVNEIIPSMNDVFINMVKSNNENAESWEK